MKKVILLMPFILMACTESKIEKMEREHNELKAKNAEKSKVINAEIDSLQKVIDNP